MLSILFLSHFEDEANSGGSQAHPRTSAELRRLSAYLPVSVSFCLPLSASLSVSVNLRA